MLSADVTPGYLYDRSCLWDRATLMPLWARGGQEAFALDRSCMHLSGLSGYRMPELLRGVFGNLGNLTPDIDFACKKAGYDVECLAIHSGTIEKFKALKDAMVAKSQGYPNVGYSLVRSRDPDDRITYDTREGLRQMIVYLDRLQAEGYPIAVPADLRAVVNLQDTALLAQIADRATALVDAFPSSQQITAMYEVMKAEADAAKKAGLPVPVVPPPPRSSRLTTGLLVAGVLTFVTGLTILAVGSSKRRRIA